MPLGMGLTQNMLFNIDIDLSGENKLDALRKKLGMTEKAAQGAGQGLNRAGMGAESAASGAENAGGQFGKMFGVGMNLMFMGMALQQVFGGLAGSMLKLVGVSQTFGAAAKSVLLPFFIEVAPLLNRIAFAFMNLPKPIKMAMGAMVALLAVLGTLLFFGAQVALLAISLQVSLTALFFTIATMVISVFGLVLAIIMLRKVFKKFGPVIGLITTLLVATLGIFGTIATSVLVLVGVFMAVIQIMNKFEGVLKAVVGFVIVAVAALVAVFVGAPVAIAAAIGAIIAVVFSLRKEIARHLGFLSKKFKSWVEGMKTTLGGIATFIKGVLSADVDQALRGLGQIFKGFGQTLNALLGTWITIFKQFGNKVFQASVDIGKKIVNGIERGISSLKNAIGDAFNNIMPDWLANNLSNSAVSSLLGGMFGTLGSMATNVNDFILTSGGEVLQPASNDTIVGFNGNGPIQPSGGGGEVVVNINDPVMKEDVDVQDVVDEVEERVNRDTRGRTGGLGN